MATAKEQLKELFPFLQRATEMEKVDKKVAYYCRMYALEQGLSIQNRCQETTEFLVSIMAQLEADKAQAGLSSDPTEDMIYIQNFALKIFNNGDKADRAGRSDKQAAQSLYASSIFLEILRQFNGGEIEADLQEKQRYAAWRAADITSALKQGRQPNPPPSGTSPAEAPEAGAGAGAGPSGLLPPPPPQQDLRGPGAASFPQPPASSSGAGLPGLAGGFPPAGGYGGAGPGGALPQQPPPQPQPRASPSRPSVSPHKPAPPPGFRAPNLAEVPSGPSQSGLPVEALANAQKAAKCAAQRAARFRTARRFAEVERGAPF